MYSEKLVSVASKMYDARRTALSLFGPEKYKVRVEEYCSIIKSVMETKGLNELGATLDILTTLKKVEQDGMPMLMALAACVEMLEPTEGL